MRDRKYHVYVVGHKCFQNWLGTASRALAAHSPLAYLFHLFPLLSTWLLLPAVLSCPALPCPSPKSEGTLAHYFTPEPCLPFLSAILLFWSVLSQLCIWPHSTRKSSNATESFQLSLQGIWFLNRADQHDSQI